jgi:uroporphyrinogen decarboxylase
MNSRERVVTALNHKEPDRVPLDIAGTIVSSITSKAYENTDYALAGTAVFGGGIFEQPSRMMGMEKFLMSLAANEEFADTVMGRILEIYIESCNRYLDLLGEYLQVFIYWNDIAGQHGPMISPDTYRRLIKPRDKRLFDAVKRKTDAKIFYHCCGACREYGRY